jgi:glutathione peroxidase
MNLKSSSSSASIPRLALFIFCLLLQPLFAPQTAGAASKDSNPVSDTASNLNTSSTQNCPAVLQHTVERLQDEKPIALCQYSGQVVLIVNTASYCGFTPQYKGLEALYDQYKSKGLVVLGFPSNDFSQEPDKNSQIADFCENTFGVKFPMFTKTSVKGAQASPLFKQLAQRTQTAPKWNFYKYLVSRDGQTIKSFNSMTSPDDRAFVAEVEKLLAAKAP